MTTLRIILFVLPFLVGILGAHWVLYVTVVRFFDVTGTGPKVALYVVPLLLTLGFVFANVLLSFGRNVLFELYAVLSVVWLGLLVYLLLAAGLVWLVYLAGRLAGHVPDMRIVCWAGLALAVAVGAYATWNARHPHVTRLTVPIRNLPDHWQGKTVVHLSDVHLGTIRGPGYARDVVQRVNALEPALVLVTGDLFDGMGGRLAALAEPLDRLDAEHGTFFVTGNHEGYLGVDEPLDALAGTSIRILDDEVVDVDGLQIVGIGFPEHDRARDPLELSDAIDPHRPSILMYHIPTDVLRSPEDRGAQQNRTYFAPDTTFDFAREHSIDLQLSGHTHQGQFFPFTIVTRLIYKGYDYGLHEVGTFRIYTTSGTGTWGPPMRLASSSEIAAITLQ
jgi:hypothetical protein